jgi:hypothetical protein
VERIVNQFVPVLVAIAFVTLRIRDDIILYLQPVRRKMSTSMCFSGPEYSAMLSLSTVSNTFFMSIVAEFNAL